ncbi:ATP-binding cassette subfamily B protein [Haloferula luteola]|uniref:ATP-binding cassette subfamily B protein n=1 Tax=Haloferula luteola TaxID=595692 RepID=A0A840V385_9BACT|nr:ABC transporter transmembrane domain-containing protein [Haloferula luteola]MBB5351953.1 ATP-binding cassette subfamily B protein [Haloferula luteola]
MPSDEEKGSRFSLGGLRWVLSYQKPHRRIFLPSLLALFVTAGLALAFPWFMKELFGGTVAKLREGVPAATVIAEADRLIFTLLGVLAVQAMIGFFRVQGFIRSGEAALNDLRRDLFRHLLRLPVPFFQEHRSGALSNRVSADLGTVRETLMTTLPQAARQSVTLVGSVVMIFVTSWKLSLAMLASIPFVVLAVAIAGRKVRGHSKAAQDALAESGTVIEESVQAIADVKAFTNEEFEEQRYQSSLDRFYQVTLRGAMARASFLAFVIFVMFGAIAGVTWLGVRMMVEGDLTEKQFSGFILYSVFVGASLGAMPEIVSQMQAMTGATDRLREIMGLKPERDGRGEPISLRGAVSFENVHFRYPSRPDQAVLAGVNFAVTPGQRIALVGPSGAGKSTVFSLLLGYYRPEQGRISFDGCDASSLDLQALREGIAVVPQEVMLFGGTILENIEYGRPGATRDEIVEAAKLANAHEFIETRPEGYETVVGPRGVKLSGGQRQRIAIARAILADPRILLLDEATSALDAESERLVNEALDRLMVGRTSLVIAHRLSTVRNADCILVLHQGRVVEQGTHEELMSAGGTYQVLVQTQLG